MNSEPVYYSPVTANPRTEGPRDAGFTTQRRVHPSASPAQPRRVDWRNTSFLVSVHIAALGGLALFVMLERVTLVACGIGLVGSVLTIFGISAGYHRLFSHRAYATGPVLRWLLLVLGAASFQTSALTWASTHRRHHRHVDRTPDPYNSSRGLWYSHVGWVLERLPESPERVPVTDLERDPLLRWQHRHTILIGACAGLVLPALIGWSLSDPWGGFLFGGPLRLFVTYHLTFSINSFVHKFGTQPYSERNTSRDSRVIALLTMGEGYHNYHHTFPLDYRNGARWHEFDPTKWTVSFWESLGLAWNLKRTPFDVIARARFRTDQARLGRSIIPEALKTRLSALSVKLNDMLTEWSALSRERKLAAQPGSVELGGRPLRQLDALDVLDLRLHEARRSFEREYRDWQRLTRPLKPLPAC